MHFVVQIYVIFLIESYKFEQKTAVFLFMPQITNL